VLPDLDYELEREEKLELVALDWVRLRVGRLSYLHILRAIPNSTRFSVDESLVICCGRDSARSGSIRAFGRPQIYRDKIFGLILSALGVAMFGLFSYIFFSELRQVPPSTGAPRVGQKLPSSRCRIKMGRMYHSVI
jgi:hypothetical protein